MPWAVLNSSWCMTILAFSWCITPQIFCTCVSFLRRLDAVAQITQRQSRNSHAVHHSSQGKHGEYRRHRGRSRSPAHHSGRPRTPYQRDGHSSESHRLRYAHISLYAGLKQLLTEVVYKFYIVACATCRSGSISACGFWIAWLVRTHTHTHT